MHPYFRAMISAFEMYYRQLVMDSFFFFGAVLMPIIYAILGLWMLGQRGGDYGIYVVVGSGLMGMWTTLMFASGNAITSERWTGTLEMLVGLPTPLQIIVAGKSLAATTQSVLSMVASYALASVLFGYALRITEPLAFLASLAVGLVSFVCLGLVLAPLWIMNPAVHNFQNALEYPVYMLAGFLFPITLLPGWTTPLSYVLAPYWAADALHAATSTGAPLDRYLFDWGMMLVLALFYLALAGLFFRIMLRKARVDASLMRDA